jgi:hypothetical protein
VIEDAHHEDLKDALRALNARLVELDDRVRDPGLACLKPAGPGLRPETDRPNRRRQARLS